MKVYNTQKAVEYLNEHNVVMVNRTLRRKLNSGIIKGSFLGRDWAVTKEELDRYISKENKKLGQ